MGPAHRWILYHMTPQGRAIHLGLTGRPQLAAQYHTVLRFFGRVLHFTCWFALFGLLGVESLITRQLHVWLTSMLAVGHVKIRSLAKERQSPCRQFRTRLCSQKLHPYRSIAQDQ